MNELLMEMAGTLELPDEDIPGFEGFGHVTLQGAPNTRDLGGLPTQDGRMVRPRRLVRSGALDRITDDDARLLAEWHDVRRVVDLRTEVEREGKPDDSSLLPDASFFDLPVLTMAEVAGLPRGQRPSTMGDLKAVRSYFSHPYESMMDMYSEAALGAQGMHSYGRFLDVLLEAPEGATLWHCTEGKDRAGLASAIVEHVLGVSPEHVLLDYLATNLFVQTWVERVLDALARHGMLKRLSADVSALFYAYREFLGHVVRLVEDEFGSIDGYIERGLGFDADKQEALRELYLVDPAAYGEAEIQEARV